MIVDWITREMNHAARIKRSTGGHGVLRRLARYEYNNTMADLLGVIDKLAEAMLSLGAFFMAIFVGWVAVGAADEMKKGASERSKRMVPLVMTAVRFVLPPVILFATTYAFIAVVREYQSAFGG